MYDVLRSVRQDLRNMPSYEAIEPVDVLARELGIPEEQIVKLDGNENPYGPASGVQEALARYPYYHIYSDPHQREVRQALAEYVGVDAGHIVCGNGSDELLDLAGRLFLEAHDAVVTAPPTFGIYAFVAAIYGARVVEVARRPDFGLDLPEMTSALRDGSKLLFLASPNNPTGNPLSREELDRLLSGDAVVVIDEAYAEFADDSFVPLVPERDNLIVLRTFSKWAGLAGLRFGYGVFPKPVAELMHKIKMPYNVNVAAQAAVLASLGAKGVLMERVCLIVGERARLSEMLSALGWLRPLPSRANFLLCEVNGPDAQDVWRRLRQKGIIIRHFDTPELRRFLRISVGRPEDTGRLVAALREIGAGVGK
ncbi:MAG: histidinol-phosphate transaminase [Chloroflexi bacterium]|nr:histidinol-phosphate transaminase [Chloroflexota bacterium]